MCGFKGRKRFLPCNRATPLIKVRNHHTKRALPKVCYKDRGETPETVTDPSA